MDLSHDNTVPYCVELRYVRFSSCPKPRDTLLLMYSCLFACNLLPNVEFIMIEPFKDGFIELVVGTFEIIVVEELVVDDTVDVVTTEPLNAIVIALPAASTPLSGVGV